MLILGKISLQKLLITWQSSLVSPNQSSHFYCPVLVFLSHSDNAVDEANIDLMLQLSLAFLACIFLENFIRMCCLLYRCLLLLLHFLLKNVNPLFLLSRLYRSPNKCTFCEQNKTLNVTQHARIHFEKVLQENIMELCYF